MYRVPKLVSDIKFLVSSNHFLSYLNKRDWYAQYKKCRIV